MDDDGDGTTVENGDNEGPVLLSSSALAGAAAATPGGGDFPMKVALNTVDCAPFPSRSPNTNEREKSYEREGESRFAREMETESVSRGS